MDDKSLLEQSARLKEEANAFLIETQLLISLQTYGTVHLAGSYSINLMLNRDIDVYVVHPDCTEDRAISALNDLIRQKKFHNFLYHDNVQFPRQGMPDGYYVGIKTPFMNFKWKVDIWFLPEDLPARLQLINTIEQASETTKLTILRLKQFVFEKKLDIGSILIYEAVLQHQITSQHEFLTFVEQRQ